MSENDELKSTKAYILELTGAQARVIQRACEIYSRLCMGQLEHVTDITIWGEAEPKEEHAIEASRIRAHANVMKFEMFGFQPAESWGIYQTPNPARTAWDIYQVIRHRLACDIRPTPERWSVDYNTPMKCGDEKLPKISSPIDDCVKSGR